MYKEKYVEIKTLEEASDDEKIVASYPTPYLNASGKKDDPKMKKYEDDAALGKCRLLVWRKVDDGIVLKPDLTSVSNVDLIAEIIRRDLHKLFLSKGSSCNDNTFDGVRSMPSRKTYE